ncbi:PREDICTED: histone-lysine N-methyltransferase SETMAR-like, partial [Polistes canadensis]|uniref:histone-lysine N-methyltransferase SETMAR-like n=1 Tax=Polistes canadensis TaxID=91411 RepID=UPI000718C8A1
MDQLKGDFCVPRTRPSTSSADNRLDNKLLGWRIIFRLRNGILRRQKKHFRHLLFFAFHRGQKVAEAARDICDGYGEGVISESTARKWFAKFKNGDFNVDDMPRSGRPSEFDEERLKSLLKENGRQTSREVGEKMNCDHKTIPNHLHSIGFTKKLETWMPHELNENNKESRLQISSQHLARHRATHGHKQRFLYRIVTGDEKWCLYINMKQRKEWVAPGDTPKPRVKPHVTQVVKAALQELEWEVLQHPPYSPDLASTDYHLFRCLSNHMKGVTFDNKEVLKNWLNNFFDTRPGDFWRNCINKLIERWKE